MRFSVPHLSGVAATLVFHSLPTISAKVCNASPPCTDGMILPAWTPTENVGTGDIVGRALVYLITMIYLFLGVSIIADRFMAAIEVITSQVSPNSEFHC